MTPNELKIWHLNVKLAVVSNNRKSIDEVIQLIYLEGRKAQVKVDAEIVVNWRESHDYEFFVGGDIREIAKAIEWQEIKL